MRRVWLIAAVAAAVLADCGDGGARGGDLPGALGYFPSDAVAVAVMPVDLEHPQVRRLGRLLRPAGIPRGDLEALLREGARAVDGVDYERDVQPLLGGHLVFGAGGPVDLEFDAPLLAVLETDGGGEVLRRLLPKLDIKPQGEHRDARLYEAGVAVDGDTLLVSFDGDRPLRAAIDRGRDGSGLEAEDFAARLAAEVPDGALLRIAGDPRPLLRHPALREAVELSYVRALRGWGAWLALEPKAIRAGAQLATEPAGLAITDLPIEAGAESPGVARVRGALSAGNRNQARTTTFLLSLARKVFGDSRFMREVRAYEREVGHYFENRPDAFEQSVLAWFSGPSASVALPDGTFAAVSHVEGAHELWHYLPRMAPRVPALARALEALGEERLMALLLLAPDAPTTPTVQLPEGVRLKTVLEDDHTGPAAPGGSWDRLYRLTGLATRRETSDPLNDPALPDEIHFGLIEDRFVVASDEPWARGIARRDPMTKRGLEQLPGVRGAAVARVDLASLPKDLLQDALGIETVALGEAVGALELSERYDRLVARLGIEVPGGLGD